MIFNAISICPYITEKTISAASPIMAANHSQKRLPYKDKKTRLRSMSVSFCAAMDARAIFSLERISSIRTFCSSRRKSISCCCMANHSRANFSSGTTGCSMVKHHSFCHQYRNTVFHPETPVTGFADFRRLEVYAFNVVPAAFHFPQIVLRRKATLLSGYVKLCGIHGIFRTNGRFILAIKSPCPQSTIAPARMP